MEHDSGRRDNRIRLGSCECIVFDDGKFADREPIRALFGNAPREPLLAVLERYRHGECDHVDLHRLCAVLYTGSHVALLDTGAGPSGGELLSRLKRAHIGREDIDTVIISHRHPGHVGGLLLPAGEMSFPNASVVDATSVRGNTRICDGVSLIPAPGHTPDHIVAVLGTGSEKMLFLGDAFLHPIHFEYPEWGPAIDSDPAAAAETRRSIIELAMETNAVLLSTHFPTPGSCFLPRNSKRCLWEPWQKSRRGAFLKFCYLGALHLDKNRTKENRMSTEANKDFIRKYLDAVSGKPKPPAVLDEYMTDEELKQHIIETETAFPNYEFTADEIIAEDDKVVVRATLKAVHTGDLMGMPPTGKAVKSPAIVIYQMKNNKIEKSWVSYDRMSVMEQLGAVPAGPQKSGSGTTL